MASSGGDTNNHDGMVRQSSSTSCASQADKNAPYLRVMKTQLNFFMTRLLFMQEQEADSLGARATNARRMNGTNSNSSMNFNNSASRLDHPIVGGVDDSGGMLGYFDEEPTGDDICVFNDNARILPNSLAKSMPPVPFPKAAPESPRKVEGKEGVRIITPTHQPADLATVKTASLPQLPFGNMAISSSNADDDDDQQQPDVVPTEDEPPLEPMEYYSEDNYEDSEVEEVPMENDDDEVAVEPEEDRKPPARKPSVTNVPLADRVFPKNQRRSKRYSSRERLPHGRSRSLGRRSDSSESESVATDDSAGLQNMDSKSCH